MLFIPGMQQSGEEYDLVKAGSIDGTDTNPHDRGIKRAKTCADLGLCMYSHQLFKFTHTNTCLSRLILVTDDPLDDPKIKGEPECTLMVGRLNRQTDEATLDQIFSKWGKIRRLRLIRDIGTHSFTLSGTSLQKHLQPFTLMPISSYVLQGRVNCMMIIG